MCLTTIISPAAAAVAAVEHFCCLQGEMVPFKQMQRLLRHINSCKAMC
jgi:hypothetical protein